MLDIDYAVKNGIIDFTEVQKQIEMKKRSEILKNHPYSIWQGANGKWYTYLPDKTKSRKKALVKRTTEEAIKNVVVDYWRSVEKTNTFKDAYFLWRKNQDQLVCENSVAKYDTDYVRFFKNDPFLNMELEKIIDDDIRVYMHRTIERLKLNRETSRKLYGYVKNTIQYARKRKILKEDPTEFLEAKDFYRWCTERYKPIESQIVVSSDMEKLQAQIAKDHEKKPEYIPTYAVEFASLVGMRVGELAALTWDSIKEDYIVVDKSEKSNREKNLFWIDSTKNGKIRFVPMTPEIKSFLSNLEAIEKKYGYYCEYVFANEKGRIHAKTISACIKTKCRQAHIQEKGIHALRKTVNSQIRAKGVSSTVAASILGHTPEVNNKYYTFDISDIKEKSRVLSEINKEVTHGNTNVCSC